MATLKNWMSDLDDNTKLNDIIMPGSHDAGMYKVTARKGLCTKNHQAITQVGDIEMQLEDGTRFFDFRVYPVFKT